MVTHRIKTFCPEAGRLALPCWLLLVAFLAATPGRAEKPVKIRAEGNAYYLWGDRIAILEDRNGEWTIGQVASAAFAGRFVTSRTGEPYNRNRSSAYWVRFTVKRVEPTPHGHYLLQVYSHNANHVSLFTPTGRGGYREAQVGDVFPFSRRQYDNRGFTFDFYPTDSAQTCYLRFRSGNEINLTSVILTPPAYFKLHFR